MRMNRAVSSGRRREQRDLGSRRRRRRGFESHFQSSMSHKYLSHPLIFKSTSVLHSLFLQKSSSQGHREPRKQKKKGRASSQGHCQPGQSINKRRLRRIKDRF